MFLNHGNVLMLEFTYKKSSNVFIHEDNFNVLESLESSAAVVHTLIFYSSEVYDCCRYLMVFNRILLRSLECSNVANTRIFVMFSNAIECYRYLIV